MIPVINGGYTTVVIKLLSVDPQNYPDAPREAIRRILELVTGVEHPRDKPVDTSRIELIRMGTTVATNALLERNGEPFCLLITKGFKDLLHIGNQSRPKIFDLEIRMPDVLYDKIIEVDERVTLVGYTATESGKIVHIPPNDNSYRKGITDELVKVLQEPNLSEIEEKLRIVFNSGIRSIAVCLMHSYTFQGIHFFP